MSTMEERYPTLDPEILEDVLTTLRGLHFDLCIKAGESRKNGGSGDYAQMKADNVQAAITEIETTRKFKVALKTMMGGE